MLQLSRSWPLPYLNLLPEQGRLNSVSLTFKCTPLSQVGYRVVREQLPNEKLQMEEFEGELNKRADLI